MIFYIDNNFTLYHYTFVLNTLGFVRKVNHMPIKYLVVMVNTREYYTISGKELDSSMYISSFNDFEKAFGSLVDKSVKDNNNIHALNLLDEARKLLKNMEDNFEQLNNIYPYIASSCGASIDILEHKISNIRSIVEKLTTNHDTGHTKQGDP